MISERKLRRFQVGLLLAAGALLAFYWFAYRSLGTWARDLDKPTTELWKRLVTQAQTNSSVRALDEAALISSVQQLRQSTALLQQAGQAAWSRIRLERETQDRLGEEFQLLEFDRHRFQMSTELRRAAEVKKVQLTEAALRGLPEFDPELTPPSLHWAQLVFARQLLATAIAAQPRAVSNLTMLPVRTHLSADGKAALLTEFPMRLEVTGSASNLMVFLASLPLRTNELAAARLEEIPGKTQPLFIDRVILKNSTANLNESSVDVVVTGFCEPPKQETTR
jgi:hypothetical protein